MAKTLRQMSAVPEFHADPAARLVRQAPLGPSSRSSWFASLHQDARLLGFRSGSFESLPLDEMMEDSSAGHGFDIRESELDDDAFRVVIGPDSEAEEMDASTIDAYFTTSGDAPILQTQEEAYDAEQRSAGGWTDAEPDPQPDYEGPVATLPHANRWGEFQRYTRIKQEERHERTNRLHHWLARPHTRQELLNFRSELLRRNLASFKRNAPTRSWELLYLTKAQLDALKEHVRIRLRSAD